jgi:hypothetical protein
MLEQLGGNRFIAMTGAKDFVSSDNPQPRLLMRLPSNLTKRRGTHMEISLLPTDEYLLVFFKNKRNDWRSSAMGENTKPTRDIIDTAASVQVGELRRVFTRMTGLDTSL